MTKKRPVEQLTPADWLLAEATRRAETQTGEFRTDDNATRKAAALDATPTRRIVERARHRQGAQTLIDRIAHWLGLLRLGLIAIPIFGLLAGAGAAGLVETRPGVIALSYALVALLLIPTLMLMLWLLLTLRKPRAGSATGLAGRAAWSGLLNIGRAVISTSGPLRASLTMLGRQHGQTVAAFATHGFWSGFFVGAILWLSLKFVGLRFDFSWETTLLTGTWMESLIISLGHLPALLPGVDLPGSDQARAVLNDVSAPAARALWAHYLLGALLIYGLLPRALLTVYFAWRWQRARLPLNLGQPGYVELLPALTGPGSESDPALGPAPPAPDSETLPPAARPGTGEPVLIGVELDQWPPRATSTRVLGRADDRDQRRGLRHALEALEPRPERIVALCSIRRSPDRGTGRWLAELRTIAPVEIRLQAQEDTGQSFDAAARLQDWSELASRFGLAFNTDAPP